MKRNNRRALSAGVALHLSFVFCLVEGCSDAKRPASAPLGFESAHAQTPFVSSDPPAWMVGLWKVSSNTVNKVMPDLNSLTYIYVKAVETNDNLSPIVEGGYLLDGYAMGTNTYGDCHEIADFNGLYMSGRRMYFGTMNPLVCTYVYSQPLDVLTLDLSDACVILRRCTNAADFRSVSNLIRILEKRQ